MTPYAFYQFWVNRTDAEMPGLLRVFSLRLARRDRVAGAGDHRRSPPPGAQRLLAEEMTTLVHGPDQLA